MEGGEEGCVERCIELEARGHDLPPRVETQHRAMGGHFEEHARHRADKGVVKPQAGEARPEVAQLLDVCMLDAVTALAEGALHTREGKADRLWSELLPVRAAHAAHSLCHVPGNTQADDLGLQPPDDW